MQVWDLRTFRLRRSVPCLYDTKLTFNAAGTVAYAILRPFAPDLARLKHKRQAIPLLTGFCTVSHSNSKITRPQMAIVLPSQLLELQSQECMQTICCEAPLKPFFQIHMVLDSTQTDSFHIKLHYVSCQN